jgi:hypothetical protein
MEEFSELDSLTTEQEEMAELFGLPAWEIQVSDVDRDNSKSNLDPLKYRYRFRTLYHAITKYP